MLAIEAQCYPGQDAALSAAHAQRTFWRGRQAAGALLGASSFWHREREGAQAAEEGVSRLNQAQQPAGLGAGLVALQQPPQRGETRSSACCARWQCQAEAGFEMAW